MRRTISFTSRCFGQGNPTDPKNLWPEPFQTSIPDGGAHAKDKVENYLHAEVCAGSLTLEQAQKENYGRLVPRLHNVGSALSGCVCLRAWQRDKIFQLVQDQHCYSNVYVLRRGYHWRRMNP